MLLIGVFLSDPWWLPGVALFGMYLIGLTVAPLVALALKRTLLRGQTPVFVMEMPSFKWPQLKTVLRRMFDAGWAFVRRAGTIILASMILVWALLYFPASAPGGGSYDEKADEARRLWEESQAQRDAAGITAGAGVAGLLQPAVDDKEEAFNTIHGDWKRRSLLGQAGQALEPVFAPLGWDWKIGMAALASFPAREVVVGTLGIIYNQGDVDPKAIREADNPAETPLGKAIEKEWSQDPVRGKYRIPVALSLMVFFALCCQCVSTLAVIRRETNSWSWPVFTFVYMTALAYVGALVTFQVGRLIVG
jgi:ferrous iron transport protein B